MNDAVIVRPAPFVKALASLDARSANVPDGIGFVSTNTKLQISPTEEIYGGLEDAFDFLNDRLFAQRLLPCAKAFVLLPRRWVVERTLAWLNRNRRLAKDFEATLESACARLLIASVKLIARRLPRA